MNRVLQHILLLASMAWLFMLSACNSSNDAAALMDGEESVDVSGKDGMVTLVLHTEVIGSTRAGVTDVPDNENMKTLRIVILHPDGTVEYNTFLDFGNAQTGYSTQIIKVRNMEKKTIYLLANESGVGGLDDLNRYTEGTAGFKDAVDDFRFQLPADQGTLIPMSSVYEVETDGREERKVCRFYLVRTATKFTFRFINMRSNDVTVNSIMLDGIADEMYLMAHKQNPELPLVFQESDGSTSSLYWVDWLKKVSDESQQYPDDKTLADRRGWITDYDIPGASNGTRTIRPALTVPRYSSGKPGEAETFFYIPESKNLKTASDIYGEQTYTMGFTLTSAGKSQTFRNQPFYNLRALFRNTHVVTDVVFNQENTITLRYTVCPWLIYEIDIPTFE